MLAPGLPLSEESPCITLYQSETTCRPDAVAELQGQFQKLQQASTNQPAETGRGQQTQCSDAAARQLEECLDAFLIAAEDFNHLFHMVYLLANSARHSSMRSLLSKTCLKVNVSMSSILACGQLAISFCSADSGCSWRYVAKCQFLQAKLTNPNLDLLQELEPWTSTMAPAVLHGIGSMAVEVDAKYSQLQALLTALNNTHIGHNKLTTFKKQNALGSQSGNLQSLLDDVATKHKCLKLQQQMLVTTEERLALSQARQPQLADL